MQYRIVLMGILILGYLQADIITASHLENPMDMKGKKALKEIETYDQSVVAVEKKQAISETISLQEENKRLKSRIIELEAQIEVLKTDAMSSNKEPTEAVAVKPAVSPKRFKGEKLKIGAKAPEKLTAYYVAKLLNLDVLKERLEANGFKILAVTPVLKGKIVVTVTNDELQKTNTLLATLQILVNEGDEIRVQNPSYFGAAYLPGRYQYGQFSNTLKALQNVLGDMYEVEEKYDLSDLGKYQFMFGMPYLNDTITVAQGEDLSAKVIGKYAAKQIAYTLKLPNGDMIVGHKLGKKTKAFLTKINIEDNANILPYESIIKGEKAVMLDPKYYLALSLPLLNMSVFMKIADTPGEIEKDIKRAYK